jgi:hypothetical protein
VESEEPILLRKGGISDPHSVKCSGSRKIHVHVAIYANVQTQVPLRVGCRCDADFRIGFHNLLEEMRLVLWHRGHNVALSFRDVGFADVAETLTVP